MTLNYVFDKGSLEDFIDSNDWTTRVYFPSDVQCGIYELHYPMTETGLGNNPDGVHMYSGMDGKFVRHIPMNDFKETTKNKILYNVNHWRVKWPLYGIDWNN